MSIFIEAVRAEDSKLKTNLESLLIIYIYKICDKNDLDLFIVYKERLHEPLFTFNCSEIDLKCRLPENLPDSAGFCVWPIIVIGKDVIAGLCSVARGIIKSCRDEKFKSLLGFKDGCLLACSEASVWTKFCEIDMPTIVKDVLLNADNYIAGNKLILPFTLIKFEYHMQQPVRMHNIYKVAREKNCDKSLKSSTPIEDLNLHHLYGEGLYITLADVLLYPCVEILFKMFGMELLERNLPLCTAWYKNITESDLKKFDFDFNKSGINDHIIIDVIHEDIPKESLYTSDPNRYKPQRRIYTKQSDIEKSISIISGSNTRIINNFLPFGYEIPFDWSRIPLEANPEGGALPKKRAGRKCEQLENITKAVIKIAGEDKHVIVDYCSGSGHLGILLATVLPNCEIILVENKEKSLERAKETIQKLNLKNIFLAQCNLDYFKGKFNIGVSLHACGVATDLVIQNCIRNKAHFVCCPCCYGGIQDCYHLRYPRSVQFSLLHISKKDYLSIAHAADQTHDENNAKTKQGFFCMDIIDNDRRLFAEAYGYKVHLGKLQPPSCTPKNNMLVGLCKTIV